VTRPTSRPVAPAASASNATPIPDSREHGATQALLRAQDPARMAPEARLVELGALLAEGFRRQLENASKDLAGGDQVEPACEPEAFDALENKEHAA
jgi:hypothetical protein